jgi:hypothetical protein
MEVHIHDYSSIQSLSYNEQAAPYAARAKYPDTFSFNHHTGRVLEIQQDHAKSTATPQTGGLM